MREKNSLTLNLQKIAEIKLDYFNGFKSALDWKEIIADFSYWGGLFSINTSLLLMVLLSSQMSVIF